MKPLKALRLFAIVSLASFGIALAVDAKKEAPAAKPAACCVTASKDGKNCTHGCCVTAAKDGKNCEKCGGAGAVATAEVPKK